MVKITKKIVELAEPRQKVYWLFDDLVKGFCSRITPAGKVDYYYQYMANKSVKRIKLGTHGIITTEQARKSAICMAAKVLEGNDPQQEKMDKRHEALVSDLAERFIEEHVQLHCKETTQKEYALYVRKYIIPYLGKMKVSEVTRPDVANIHHSLRCKPVAANHCLSVISTMFNLAELWGLRKDGTNPCRHIKKNPTGKRERYLSTQEAKRLGKVLNEKKQYPDENIAAIYCIQLLLLTGCRCNEIKTLKWEYIDYENRFIRLPDSKTGPRVVYVGEVVFHVLKEIQQHLARPEDNPYVIWGKYEGAHLNNLQKPWSRIRKEVGIEDVRIHDLRHSFASFAVSQGMSLAMIGKLLGHTQVQTTARYAHIMSSPMKKAATDITGHLSELIAIDVLDMPTNTQQVKEPDAVTIQRTDIILEKFLDSEQAAEFLGVKRKTLDDWRYRKAGPKFQKVGHRVRYRISDLDKFVNT